MYVIVLVHTLYINFMHIKISLIYTHKHTTNTKKVTAQTTIQYIHTMQQVWHIACQAL